MALQWASVSARRGKVYALKSGLLVGGFLACVFLAGQLWVWQQLNALNYGIAANPANSFFYLITGLHGLHLLGGLFAWGVTTSRVWRGAKTTKDRDVLRLHVMLCARYWHFLLLVWLVLFGLLLYT